MQAAEAVGIDVGGSSIKGCLVNVSDGAISGGIERIESPTGFRPEAVLKSVADLAERLGGAATVGVGFPAVVADGLLLTDPTSHEWPGWKGLDIAGELRRLTDRDVSVANDADVAALAEHAFGAARGAGGTVLVLTLGTGIGSGLISEGRLVPNIELGRIFLAGEREVAEEQCSARILSEQNLGWPEFAERLQRYLTHIERFVAPGLIVIGGAVSSEGESFLPLIETRARLVTADLLGDAGMVGAALIGAERHGSGSGG